MTPRAYSASPRRQLRRAALRAFTAAETLIALGLLSMSLLVFSGLSSSTAAQSAAATRATGLWLAFRTVGTLLADPAKVPYTMAKGDTVLATFFFSSDGAEVAGDSPSAVWSIGLSPVKAPGWNGSGLQALAARATELGSGQVQDTLLLQRRAPPP